MGKCEIGNGHQTLYDSRFQTSGEPSRTQTCDPLVKSSRVECPSRVSSLYRVGKREVYVLPRSLCVATYLSSAVTVAVKPRSPSVTSARTRQRRDSRYPRAPELSEGFTKSESGC